MRSLSAISVPASAQISSRWYQSRQDRARRDTSNPNTRPTWPSPASATSRWKPGRASAEAPEQPRSSSMTLTRGRGQPTGAFGDTVLQRRGLAMLLELLQRGLSNVDDGPPVKMARLDLARQHRAGRAHRRRPHGPSPLRGSSTAGAAVPSGRSGRPVCADPLPVSRARTEPPGPCRGLPRHVALQRASANSASALAKTCNATSFAEVPRTEVVSLREEAGKGPVHLAVAGRGCGDDYTGAARL